ncbi:hypothetical protein ACLOJK_011178 [Asimina triloba]
MRPNSLSSLGKTVVYVPPCKSSTAKSYREAVCWHIALAKETIRIEICLGGDGLDLARMEESGSAKASSGSMGNTKALWTHNAPKATAKAPRQPTRVTLPHLLGPFLVPRTFSHREGGADRRWCKLASSRTPLTEIGRGGRMAQTVGRNIAGPLLFLNLIMYIIVVGLASWNLNKFINGMTNYPGVAGNGATFYFQIFAILAGVIGIVSKLAGGNHIRAWRNDSLAAAASSSLIAWAITALAFGLACKEIATGGHRGWRLRALEAFIIILTFTQLVYVLILHAGIFSSKYGPGYRDSDYVIGTGTGTAAGVDPALKGTARV